MTALVVRGIAEPVAANHGAALNYYPFTNFAAVFDSNIFKNLTIIANHHIIANHRSGMDPDPVANSDPVANYRHGANGNFRRYPTIFTHHGFFMDTGGCKGRCQ